MYEYYCLPEEISIALLEQKSAELMQNHKYAEIVYMSPDIYNVFITSVEKMYQTRMSASPNVGMNTMTMHLPCGQVKIQPLSSKYRRLLIVGNQDDLNRFEYNGVPVEFLSDTERRKIDRDFETTVLGTASDSIDDDINTIFFNSND